MAVALNPGAACIFFGPARTLDNALFIFFPLLKTVSGNRGRSGWRRSNSAIPSIPENAFGGSLLHSQTNGRILCLAGCALACRRRGV